MEILSKTIAGSQQELLDHLEDVIRYRMLYRTITTPGLAIGTGSKTAVRVVNTTPYLHNGEFKSKTAAEVNFTATTHDVADGYKRKYLIEIDGSGTLSINAGTAALIAGTTYWPTPSADKTVLGGIEISVSGNIFDATTDELDEAHITDTYYNFGVAPFPSFDSAI